MDSQCQKPSKLFNIAHFDLIIVFISLWTKLDFFQFNDFLLQLGLMLALLLSVAKFAVIHELGNRRFCGGGNFYQIYIGIRCHAQCIAHFNNSQLLAFLSNEANLNGGDFTVNAVLALVSRFAVVARITVIACSYGSTPELIIRDFKRKPFCCVPNYCARTV